MISKLKYSLVLVLAIGCSRLLAADVPPPSTMSLADAVRLDRDLAHIREANSEIRRIQSEARKYVNDVAAILKASKIDPDAFDNGEVSVEFDTGAITRKTATAVLSPKLPPKR